MTGSPLEPTLAPFDAARVATLEWRQPRRGRREWELIADGVTVATLHRRGSLHVARTAGDPWRIRHGLLGRCDITREGDDAPVADSRRRGFRTVEIRRANGESLLWRRTGFFRAVHRLENREGFPLVTEQVRRGFFLREGSLALEEAGRTLPDLLPLLLLLWALTQLEARAHAH